MRFTLHRCPTTNVPPKGNDLSRVLRWGPGYSGEDPSHILACVDEADEVLMDRWTILLDAQDLAENCADAFLEAPKVCACLTMSKCKIPQKIIPVSADVHHCPRLST